MPLPDINQMAMAVELYICMVFSSGQAIQTKIIAGLKIASAVTIRAGLLVSPSGKVQEHISLASGDRVHPVS